MKLEAIRALLEPHVAPRMRLLEPTADLGNGTPLADAATTITCHVIGRRGPRVAKDPSAAAQTLSDDELRHIIGSVRDLMLSTDNKDAVDLPNGVRLEPGHRTGVGIGQNHFVPLRGRPGLHGMSNLMDRYHPDRPGSRRLREEVAFHMMRLPRMDVRPPSVDEIKVVNEYRYRDTLLVPMRGGPGVTYMDSETIEPAETMLDIEIDITARTAAGKALDLWEKRGRVDAAYADVIAEIGPLIGQQQAKGMPVRLVGVRITDRNHQSLLPIAIPILEVLGNDLKPAMWEPYVDPRQTTLTKVFLTQMGTQRRRKRIRDESEADGKRGRIDRVTLAAVRRWAKDPAEVLRQMARDKRATIRTDDTRHPVRLVWRDGEVKASFAFTHAVVWQQGTLIVKTTQFPTSVLDSLPGRPIRTLIDHPFLQADDMIRSVKPSDREGGWTRFHVATSWTTFDADTGEVADDTRLAA